MCVCVCVCEWCLVCLYDLCAVAAVATATPTYAIVQNHRRAVLAAKAHSVADMLASTMYELARVSTLCRLWILDLDLHQRKTRWAELPSYDIKIEHGRSTRNAREPKRKKKTLGKKWTKRYNKINNIVSVLWFAVLAAQHIDWTRQNKRKKEKKKTKQRRNKQHTIRLSANDDDLCLYGYHARLASDGRSRGATGKKTTTFAAHYILLILTHFN